MTIMSLLPMVFENVFISIPKRHLWALLIVTVPIQMIETGRKKVCWYESIPSVEGDCWLPGAPGCLAAWSSISRADFSPQAQCVGCGVGRWLAPWAPAPSPWGWPPWPLPVQLKWAQQAPSRGLGLRPWLSATKMVMGENICLWSHHYHQSEYSPPFLFK